MPSDTVKIYALFQIIFQCIFDNVHSTYSTSSQIYLVLRIAKGRVSRIYWNE